MDSTLHPFVTYSFTRLLWLKRAGWNDAFLAKLLAQFTSPHMQ
jgi:hypothetical protein